MDHHHHLPVVHRIFQQLAMDVVRHQRRPPARDGKRLHPAAAVGVTFHRPVLCSFRRQPSWLACAAGSITFS